MLKSWGDTIIFLFPGPSGPSGPSGDEQGMTEEGPSRINYNYFMSAEYYLHYSTSNYILLSLIIFKKQSYTVKNVCLGAVSYTGTLEEHFPTGPKVINRQQCYIVLSVN